MSTATFIYALNDPDTGKCRYVGASAKPSRRYFGHLTAVENCPRTAWIKSLKADGKRPVLEVLDEVPALEWEFWEKEYIRVFRAIGFDLTNKTAGGAGFTGKHSEESRALISAVQLGRKPTREARTNQSAAQNGVLKGIYKSNSSGFVGVYWQAETKKWRSQAPSLGAGRRPNLGYFSKVEDAVFARALYVGIHS